MKKVIYVVVVLVILLVLSMLLKDNKPTTSEVVAPAPVANEVVAEATVTSAPDNAVVKDAAVVAEVPPLEEGAVVVDVEPTADGEVVEELVEDVVEEDPATTADEGETVVE